MKGVVNYRTLNPGHLFPVERPWSRLQANLGYISACTQAASILLLALLLCLLARVEVQASTWLEKDYLEEAGQHLHPGHYLRMTLGGDEIDDLISDCIMFQELTQTEILDLLGRLREIYSNRSYDFTPAQHEICNRSFDGIEKELCAQGELWMDSERFLLTLDGFVARILGPPVKSFELHRLQALSARENTSRLTSFCGFLFGLGETLLGGVVVASGVGLEIASCGTYTVSFGFHESVGIGLIAHGCSTAAYYGYDVLHPTQHYTPATSGNWQPNLLNSDLGGYAPERKLPTGSGGRRIPDSDTPHTQLGIRNGSRGQYRQGREWDEHGDIVRDIDFTDHGYPHIHSNPHQHVYTDNPTGGSRRRGDPEALPNWSYI